MIASAAAGKPWSWILVDLDILTRVLVQTARERRPVTYGQLLRYFGHRVNRASVAGLCRDLGKVRPSLDALGAPDLACLVVRKSDATPGEGYFLACIAERSYQGPVQGPLAQAFLLSRQEAAFAWAATRAEQAPAPMEP